MHRYSFSPLLVVACSLLLVQCGGGGDSGGNQVSGGALEGVVSTKEGAPLADVFVSAYGASAKSDGSGRFRIENVALPADRVVATLQKDGYFSLTVGTRAAPAGETTNVRAVLLPRELVGEIDGTTGGKASNAELSVEAPPSAFVDSTGTPAGKARVFAAYFDPDRETFGSEMPGGDLTAEDAKGDPGVLTSFGAAVVEAESENGDPLSLAKDVATCLKIPPGLASSAPASIAVWTLDAQGRWKEVGVADRVNGQYCFQSGTLGPVNCDLFSRSALISGRVCDAAGKPVGGTSVKIGQVSTMTAGDGTYSVVIPKGSNVKFTSAHGDDMLCSVEPDSTRELDLGACPAAKKGDGTCSPPIDHGVVLKDASGRSWQSPPPDGSPRQWFTFEEAKDYCKGLDLEGPGWTLPTLADLRSLIEGCPATEASAPLCEVAKAEVSACTCSYQPAGPALNGCYWQSAFNGHDCDQDLWSSTTADASRGWTVEFRRAMLGVQALSTQNGVMCVR